MDPFSYETDWDAIFGQGGMVSAEMEAEYASSRAVAANYDIMNDSFVSDDPFVDTNTQGPVNNTAFAAGTPSLQSDVSTEPAWTTEMASNGAPSFLTSEHISTNQYSPLDENGVPEFLNSSDVSFENMQSEEETVISDRSMQGFQQQSFLPADKPSTPSPQQNTPSTKLTPSATPLSSDGTDALPQIIAGQVESFLCSARGNPQHQSTATLFQDDAGAKRWRKRGQAHAKFDASDTAFPRTTAEQREYINLLKSAFKYMGPGTKYNPQEYVFMTKSRNPDREKQIEAWCWQLLTQIIRRQSTGRPLDLAKRTKGNLDRKDLTFAERFSTVYNALKFEKRCAIRFCNLAGWHKRFANDPQSEMHEITKNDWINNGKAKEKKKLQALAEEKAKDRPKKRGAGDMYAEEGNDSPLASASEYENSTKKVRATRKREMPRRKSALSKVQDDTDPTARWRSPSIPISSSGTSLSPSPSPYAGWDSPSAAHQSNGNFSQQTDILDPSRFKKLMLDNGSAGSAGSSTPSRFGAANDPSLGVNPMRRSSSLREMSLPPTDIADFAPPQSQYDSSLSALPHLGAASANSPINGQHSSQQLLTQLPSTHSTASTNANSQPYPVTIPDAILAIDTRVLPAGFTSQQVCCARRMGMYTHEYVNFARIRNNLPPIDWAKHMRPRPAMPS